MNLKKLFWLNVIMILGLSLFFHLVIVFKATKITTWTDTILIPILLSVFLAILLNLSIIIGNKLNK